MTTTEVTIEIVCNILGKVKVRFEIQDFMYSMVWDIIDTKQ
jgi:hypothetical protein